MSAIYTQLKIASLLFLLVLSAFLFFGILLFTLDTCSYAITITPGHLRLDVSTMEQHPLHPDIFIKQMKNEKLSLHFIRPLQKDQKLKAVSLRSAMPDMCDLETCFLSIPILYDIPTSYTNLTMLEIWRRIENQWNAASGRIFFCGDSCRTIRATSGILRNYRNQIDFGRIEVVGYPSLSDALAVTAIWSAYDGTVLEMDIFFNTATYCIWDALLHPLCYDFETIALHEFGHLLCWNDLPSYPDSLMHGYLDVGVVQRSVDVPTANCTETHFDSMDAMAVLPGCMSRASGWF